MASVFTFDPDPPKLSSPWPSQHVSDSLHTSVEGTVVLTGGETLLVSHLADCGVTRLKAEPQDGPTEYKLHLLLRPRRSFSALSTVHHVSGSHHSKSGGLQGDMKAELGQARLSPGPAPNSHSRQNRLEHLTTQLLWRLQQSSPYHSSSKSDLVVPVLPQADATLHVQGPEKLLPGLEESQGALYEIGVSDDGVFVGLTEDELDESLTTLRAMASSLGCKVEVLRMVLVGTCQWTEEIMHPDGIGAAGEVHSENLWVAEALVTPDYDPHHMTALGSLESDMTSQSEFGTGSRSSETEQVESQAEQLRVSLTGSTTSGKSSLLGTLSTSTLDNGRGKSRLSLLKHRHEIVSGISSSVTPELIGYHDTSIGLSSMVARTNVINYAYGNVSSWNDIHSASEPGRLVFFTDSAGHPRYRRTIVRGLVSWAPHWTICCVAADGKDRSDSKTGAASSSQQTLDAHCGGTDSSEAHLILALKLGLPLVVVVTKLDLALKNGLRQTLTRILSILKYAGRQPAILSAASTHSQENQIHALMKEDEDRVLRTISSVSERDIGLLVPIVLTSAVTGAGIGKLHALLRHLPIPCALDISPSSHPFFETSRPTVLFHVDDVFNISDSQPQSGMTGSKGVVLSGHLRYGTLMIGGDLLVGPFTSDAALDDSVRRDMHRAKSFSRQYHRSPRKLAISYDGYWPPSTAGAHEPDRWATTAPPGWQKVSITSLRNLRLPVRKLLAGQVGTVGITFCGLDATKTDLPHCRIRKGMVLIKQPNGFDHHQPTLCRVFTTLFDEFNTRSMICGMPVTVYIASIRASAKIVTVQTQPTSPHRVFHFDESNSDRDGDVGPNILRARHKKVAFQFVNSREWIELGTQVLVMPAGGHGTGRSDGGDHANVGLGGSVGKITETLE